MNRNEIEQAIIDTSFMIPKSRETVADMVSGEELVKFIDLWRQLAHYYRKTEDTDIGVIAMEKYLQMEGHLSSILNNESDVPANLELIEEVEELRDDLVHWMSEIGREVANTLSSSSK